MSGPMEFVPLESDDTLPPSDDTTEPATSDELSCVVCAAPLFYGGRGRKPKYCDDHKPIRTATGTGKGSAKNIDVLIAQMTDLYLTMSAGLSFIPAAQADGMIIAVEANRLAESWRPLILRDPKIRQFWEKVCTGGGWGTVLMAHGMIAMAIANNHGVTLPGLKKAVNNV